MMITNGGQLIMAVNKVVENHNGVTTIVLDVSGTTATDDKVAKGYKYKRADGSDGEGTMVENEPAAITNPEDIASYASEENVGSVVKYNGETTTTYENGRLYIVEEVQ
jgi:hypothetical protein